MELEYQNHKARWQIGERDRELGLQLMFYAWMHWADPEFITGLTDDPDAQRLWHEIFEYSGGETSSDAEFLFVAGVMAHIFPYVLGPEEEWTRRGAAMITKAILMQPNKLSLDIFDNRDDYGRYFSDQLRGHLSE